MKFWIWLGCTAVYCFIVNLLRRFGVVLGLIPTLVLYGITFFAARTLCQR